MRNCKESICMASNTSFLIHLESLQSCAKKIPSRKLYRSEDRRPHKRKAGDSKYSKNPKIIGFETIVFVTLCKSATVYFGDVLPAFTFN